MRIGLTIRDLKNYKNKIYSSGIDQHIMFFFKYLDQKTDADVYLLSNNNDNFDKFLDINDINSYKKLDVVILIGYSLMNSIHSVCLQNNIKIISYRLGHSFIIDLDPMLKKSQGGMLTIGSDEIWILPDNGYTQDYYKYIYKTDKVYVAPFFWQPEYITETSIK